MLAALGSSFLSCMIVSLFTLPGVAALDATQLGVARLGVALLGVVGEAPGPPAPAIASPPAYAPPSAYASPSAFGEGTAPSMASQAGYTSGAVAGTPTRHSAPLSSAPLDSAPLNSGPSNSAPASVLALEAARKKFAALQLGTLTKQEWRAAIEHYGMDYGLRALLVLVLMISAWTVSNWAAALVDSGLQRIRFDETLTKFLAKLVRWGLLLMAGLVCLGYFGVETTSFAALLGAAGLAIGLAFQGTLSNFASGAMLLVFRPYKVGDLVNVAGHLGKVYEIELFTTAIDTLDNRRIIVPNNSIYGTVIENITFHARRRIEVPVGVSYDADIDRTREVLNRALASIPQLAKDPPPAATLLELGSSSVNWAVRGWAANADYGVAKEALVRAVKVELDRAGISIPFPQLDIHIPSSVATLPAMRAA